VMGAGASTAVTASAASASTDDLEAALSGVGVEGATKIRAALDSIQAKAKPTVWISSSGLPSDELKSAFMATVLRKRGVFDEADAGLAPPEMVKKYKSTLETCKQVHIMDALYFRDWDVIKKWRDEIAMFFWDDEIVRHCGFLRENVTTICLNMKPWLFEDPGQPGMWSPQSPKSEVTAEEKDNYMAKLKQCRDAYASLKKDPPEIPAKCSSGKSVADELCEASQALNKKYKDQLVKWCNRVLAGADCVTGQGGDVVNLNMTFQCNQRVAQALVRFVRGGKTIYAAHSAGAMCMAKSMEMTKEISPGWLETFAVSKEYLLASGIAGGAMFDTKDLDGDGVEVNVLGALPMFESPFAMRPHFKEAWIAEVLEKNKMAEAECEAETGKDISDELVKNSSKGVQAAINLLNIVSQNAADQDCPVFLPLLDGQVIVGEWRGGNEVFHVIGKPTGKPPDTRG